MPDTPSPLFEFLLRQGDSALVLGHRTSEWCGLAPAIEEDIALANIALDLIGQAKLWLEYAGEERCRAHCKRSCLSSGCLRFSQPSDVGIAKRRFWTHDHAPFFL